MFFHPWPFIERDLFEKLRGCMKWQRTTKKVEIEFFFRIRQETYHTKRVSFYLKRVDFFLPQDDWSIFTAR